MKNIAVLLLLAGAAPLFSQTPPPDQLFTMVNGVPTPVASTLTTGQLPQTPPPILAKCVNGTTIVDCNFGSGGSGTVNPGTTGKLAYYAADGAVVSGAPGVSGDGANGLAVAGKVATPNVNGSVYASQYATGGDGTPSNPWTSASGTGGIEEAILAVGTTSGNPASRTVVINPGYYSITAPILNTTGVNLIGTGWDSVLYVSASMGSTSDVILIQPTASAQVKGFRVEDFTILPASGTPARCGIMLDGTSNEIQQGLIRHININKLGSNAVCAVGSGAAQGTPVLTAIDNSILTGGFSCTACGDSVTLRNNQMAGAGANTISFQTGATGFIFDANNVTIDGGTQIAGGNTFAPKFTKNEFEAAVTFTGSNASLLDFDGAGGAIVGGVIRDNTFNVISPLVGNAVRLNVANNVLVEGNTFTRGASGSTDVVLTSNSGSDQVGTNYWKSGGPLASMVSDSGNNNILFFPYLNGVTAAGPTLQNLRPLLMIGAGGTTYPLLGNDASDAVTLYGYRGAKIAQQVTGTTFIYNGINGQIVAVFSAAGNASAGSSTVASMYALAAGTGHILWTTTAPTIGSGFGTSPSVASSNGTSVFLVGVGSGGTATSGTITLPAATNGWDCSCQDITTQSATVFLTKQTGTSTTSCTVANFDTSGAQAAWASADQLSCRALAR